MGIGTRIRQPAMSGPVPPCDRINAIDALRGFALFGVLAINLHTEFRVTLFEQFVLAPVRGGVLDRAATALLSLAFEFKAFALFSLLFGVGLAIQFDRLASNPRRTTLLVRRLLILLAFGLIHLLLIWNGDILTEYALAGLLILPILFAPPAAPLVCAVLLFVAYLLMGWIPLPFSFPDTIWLTQHIPQARDAYGQGSLGQAAMVRIAEIPEIAKLHTYVFPRTMALMLFGVWAWRSGLFRRLPERARPLLGVAICLVPVGILFSLEQYGFTSLAGDSEIAKRLIDAVAPIVLALGYAVLLLGIVTIRSVATSDFIYFQF